jgi:hypothetical protein
MGMRSRYDGYTVNSYDGKDYTKDLSNEQIRRVKELLGIKDSSDLEREYIAPVRETKKKKGGFRGFTDGKESERFNELVNHNEKNPQHQIPKKKKSKPENKKLPAKVAQHYPKKKPSTDEQMEKISNFAKKAAPFVIPIAMTWITNKMMNK